jgi:hypothetical protein
MFERNPKSGGVCRMTRKFTMEFEPATIEHLGLKLYVSLPPVIGELVSNAWDADAEKVEVTFPEGPLNGESEVVVKDFGAGMDANELQNAYLKIGRNRREVDGFEITKKFKRQIMGRKGIGKLSAFGVASELEVRSIKDGNAICLRLNYDEMTSWPKGTPYEPTVVESRTGPTSEPNGTEIRIRKLHREKPIEANWIRRELARRYTVIGSNFKVFVNGTEIAPKDRRLRKDCKKSWDVSDIDIEGGNVVDASAGWKVEGWVGLVAKSAQVERGVDVFARGKAVELETMFGLKTTTIQFARAYVVGEITANFLDATEDDIATGRNLVHWESERGQKLAIWGQTALKWIFNQWLDLQHKEKEEKIVKIAGFKEWMSTRTPHEQRIAQKLVNAIVNDDNIESESAGPLLEIVKTNIEFQAFQELVDEIEESGYNVVTLLKLFEDWRVIEAREHLRLSDGRLEVMEKLNKFIQEGALEVKQMQPLFEENGWLVDPTWGEVSGQTTYTQLLRKNFQEPKDLPESDRRMDILGYSLGGTLTVVELKRPEKTLSRKDLDQIEQYVDWARANLTGTGPDSPGYIRGVLIVGKLGGDGEAKEKMKRLAGYDIRVETFRDLLHKAETVYGEVEKRLKKVAPEYSREARKARKAKK